MGLDSPPKKVAKLQQVLVKAQGLCEGEDEVEVKSALDMVTFANNKLGVPTDPPLLVGLEESRKVEREDIGRENQTNSALNVTKIEIEKVWMRFQLIFYINCSMLTLCNFSRRKALSYVYVIDLF